MCLLEQIDIRRPDIDMELFTAALALRHLRSLIASGGSEFGRPGLEGMLPPQVIEAFLERAVAWARHNHLFEQEWVRLQRGIPAMKQAWGKGQQLFQQHLAEAQMNRESKEYLPQGDFAVDCYATVAARTEYTTSQAQQNWLINGYMVAWGNHFGNDTQKDNKEVM
jgi:hypothetical protein